MECVRPLADLLVKRVRMQSPQRQLIIQYCQEKRIWVRFSSSLPAYSS